MKNISALVFFLAFVSTTSLLAEDDWGSYQHDNFRSGRSDISIDPAQLEMAWSASESFFTTPLVVGDTIYATRSNLGNARNDTIVKAFDLATGDERWTFRENFSSSSQAAYGAGFVVIAGSERASDFEGLYVLDANSGELKYRVELADASGGMPTVHVEADGSVRAYYYSKRAYVYGVDLEETSGNLRWTGRASYSSASPPTIGGDSVFVSGPGTSFAFDRDTGAVNPFFDGGIRGGGGSTPVFDKHRNRIYTTQSTRRGDALVAFDYVDNGNITERWRYTGSAQEGDASNIALLADGNIMSTSSSTLAVIDSETGLEMEVRHSLPLANGNSPALSDGYIWTIGEYNVDIYDASTLALAHALPDSRGNLNTQFDSPGAFFELSNGLSGFVHDDAVGFDVFVVPEPSSHVLPILLFVVWAMRTRLRRRRDVV